jgi:hypothetical protein
MKIEFTAKEPTHLRVRYNDKVIYDQVLPVGPHDIDVVHPKTCGKAEASFVYGEEEMLLGTADYGECKCAAGSH